MALTASAQTSPSPSSPGLTSLDISTQTPGRIEAAPQAVDELQVTYLNTVIHLTASFGVVSGVPDEKSTPQNFLAKADKMLYLAKDGGRNCVQASPLRAALAPTKQTLKQLEPIHESIPCC